VATAPIPHGDRLIVALDLPRTDEAKALVEELGEAVAFYKVGLELFLTDRPFELVEWLGGRGKRVMADLKLFDVPRTVGAAVRQLRGRGVTFATVHGNDAILAAACREKGEVGILAVTVLTSLDQRDLEELGFAVDLSAVVLSRARRALALGCDGVVSSGLEVPALRRELGEALAVVVPGVRPLLNREPDDQKRTVDVEEAFARGADYIVVGRPITSAPDRRAAAVAIQERIAAQFANVSGAGVSGAG
jgi:orotidine-5'-phosphate decarboxylase